jgi:hypothetical protein
MEPLNFVRGEACTEVIEDVWSVDREPLLLFVRGVMRVKSISFC